ncbi:hypothetical protein VTI74DRAFT_416 [Chaetomium olivicolor]
MGMKSGGATPRVSKRGSKASLAAHDVNHPRFVGHPPRAAWDMACMVLGRLAVLSRHKGPSDDLFAVRSAGKRMRARRRGVQVPRSVCWWRASNHGCCFQACSRDRQATELGPGRRPFVPVNNNQAVCKRPSASARSNEVGHVADKATERAGCCASGCRVRVRRAPLGRYARSCDRSAGKSASPGHREKLRRFRFGR